ncbi:DUF3375 domain-containing protein [Thioalkalivibrio sp.]|uniref:DUF3375 domain-containing protein n=1 Tax=Thioalkalivibrio sp. TaxID=2093813 RepID=UPI003562F159
MEHDHIQYLRRNHPGWRLLTSDNAPLILGFLHQAYIESNARALSEQELVGKLEDYLFHLRNQEGEGLYPKAARDYLNDWAADERGWLRRYYPQQSDEPHFDLMPATEQAIHWVAALEERPQFVGAESRLRMVFDLLRELVHGAETDPQAQLLELERQRAELDARIQNLRDGQLERLDPTRLRERFLQAEGTARGLLADFRQVEQNFRDLDRQVRERIATWDGTRGDLLGDIFGEQDAIAESDQGRSFSAFWDFLMSPARQEELSDLLERALQLEPVTELRPDPRIRRIHYDWLEAGETTQRTVARLSQQLRRFLDDQAWLENRRIMDLIRDVEQQALALRASPPGGGVMELDEPGPSVELPMERPLFVPPLKPDIQDTVLMDGETDIDPAALFEQAWVDRDLLRGHIRHALHRHSPASLSTVLEAHPLEQGLAELVTYLAIATEDPHTVIDETRSESVTWIDPDGQQRRARLPVILFTREGVQ